MGKLIKELVKREFEATIRYGAMYIILGNVEYRIENDKDARKVYKIIKKYW